jgi:hypothetical protein
MNYMPFGFQKFLFERKKKRNWAFLYTCEEGFRFRFRPFRNFDHSTRPISRLMKRASNPKMSKARLFSYTLEA